MTASPQNSVFTFSLLWKDSILTIRSFFFFFLEILEIMFEFSFYHYNDDSEERLLEI